MSSRLAYKIYQLFWNGLDWLFPPYCGGCGKSTIRWCRDCQSNTEKILSPICPVCGRTQPNDQICHTCDELHPDFIACRSWAVYRGPIRTAIHKMKYRRDIGLGEILSRPMINLLNTLCWDIDLISPVPLNKKRYSERGYNQSSLLALPIALSTRLQYHPSALTRFRDTQSQVGLTREGRDKNIKGAFKAKHSIVNNKCVLVIDDVMTSGATMNSCANALLDAGAKQVYGLTLAKAILSFRGEDINEDIGIL